MEGSAQTARAVRSGGGGGLPLPLPLPLPPRVRARTDPRAPRDRLKAKRPKNVTLDELGVTHGTVHMQRQDFGALNLKKTKATRAERASGRGGRAGEGADEGGDGGGDDDGDDGDGDDGDDAPAPVRQVGKKAARGAK